MEQRDNPVDRMLSNMQYRQEPGDELDEILSQLKALRNHPPSTLLMNHLSSLVRQGKRLNHQQRFDLQAAMDGVLRCGQAMEESMGAETEEMEEYYQDSQNIAMNFATQLSSILTDKRRDEINGSRENLLMALERRGIEVKPADPLEAPQADADLPLGWEQPSLFSSEPDKTPLPHDYEESEHSSAGAESILSGAGRLEALIKDNNGYREEEHDRSPIDNTITAEQLGPMSYDSPMSYTGDAEVERSGSTAVALEKGEEEQAEDLGK